jgi:carbohydrate kinase (thermoresistant glucokinase family)
MSTHLVVMGVSGTGKTTIAEALRRDLGWAFVEGDDLHSPANVAKMSAGTPLTDEDRWPWLETIVAWTATEDAGQRDTVVSCSALRRSYRDLLRTAPGRTVFVHLTGTAELLAERMAGRSGHFMPSALLQSQLSTLEPLQPDEDGITVDVDDSAGAIAADVARRLSLKTS